MKNYYEILAYADREDLLVEKTNTDTYIGFKDGENSKTLFKFSDGTDPLKDFLEELQNTKYKESNLYKVVAKAFIKDLIDDLKFVTYEIKGNIAVIEEFVYITGYKYDEEDIAHLDYHGITQDDKGNLVHKSFLTKKWLLDDIFRTKKIQISEKNLKNIELIMPDYSYIIAEIDDSILDSNFYYNYHYHAESILEDSFYYYELRHDINNLLHMIKNNKITVEYENKKLKDIATMKSFWALSDASNLADNNDCHFPKEYLNYYNIFYEGEIVGSEKMML